VVWDFLVCLLLFFCAYSSALNLLRFSDMLQIEGKYQQKATPPFVPVMYVAGEIIEIGPDCETGFEVGDRVVGNAADGPGGHKCGGLATEALVWGAGDGCANRLPDFVSDEVALAMHENYWDCHHAVKVCGEVSKGDTLMVLGASGACGMAAIGE
jgi:NADPH2:quinone reductase